ncbi:TolC family protein [Vibrio sp. CAIM 722]|uniref:TolC family protein n=2 Tax=Vibrio eleionomae TaxID=2653505 RepID=A0A7X4LM21_9VIBR|nr:TolC family protein [Vibrio eleionomae]
MIKFLHIPLYPLSLMVQLALFAPFAISAPISFDQAWQILQQDNNSLAAERANVERYTHLKDATWAMNLPQVTVGAQYTRLNDAVTLDLPLPSALQQIIASLNANLAGSSGLSAELSQKDVVTSSIRAIWPIFTGGQISAAQDAAQGKADEAQGNLKMEVLARYEDLAKYYFSVVLAREVLNTRQAVVIGLTKHRDNAAKLEQQGQIAHVERLQADASLDKAIVEQKKAQKSLDIAQSALTKILGQSTLVEPGDPLFINTDLPPMAAFTEQTLTTYPGLAILDAKQNQAQNLKKAQYGKYSPQVYLYGNYNLYEDDSVVSDLNPDWMVGIGVSIPLMENTGRSDQVKAAASAITQIRYLKAQAKEDLSVLVQRTYQQAEQALEEVQGLQSSLTLAKENLRLREKAFNQGLSTSVDVVDAELNQASIQTQQSVASFNYLIALTKLLALSSEMTTFQHYRHSAVFLTHGQASTQMPSVKRP